MKPLDPHDPGKLADVDPEFARVVSALRASGPSRSALEKTLAAAESAAMSSGTMGASRPKAGSLASWIGLGFVLAGVSVGGYEWQLHRHANANANADALAQAGDALSTPSRDAHAAGALGTPAPEAVQPGAQTEVPTDATVRVEDLPPASTASTASATKLGMRDVGAGPAKSKTSAPGATNPAAAAREGSSADDAPSTADSFREELALVERARSQASRGETASALRSLDEYEQRFPKGAFVHEVSVMRIEALASSGDADRARAFGQRFLTQNPTSPYAARVRSVLANTK